MAEDLNQQLALLKALADRPLTLPPVYAKITGSITAGLLLNQVLYWMRKTSDPEGWFYKRLPEFQEEMCMGEKELRTARGILTERKFLETKRRGIPPVVWFRADLLAVLQAVQKQLKNESLSDERAESIPPKGQNRLRQNAASTPTKGQNHDSDQRAESYKEAETTRDYPKNTQAHELARELLRRRRAQKDTSAVRERLGRTLGTMNADIIDRFIELEAAG